MKNNKWEFQCSSISSTVFRSNWNLEMLIFVEEGKLVGSTQREKPCSKDENQQQTQPTYDTGSEIRTHATLVGGECNHHCTIPAPLYIGYILGEYLPSTLLV